MAEMIDMYSTYCRRARIPVGLTEEVEGVEYKPEVIDLLGKLQSGSYSHKKILFAGFNRGKTTNACALLRAYLKSRRDVISSDCPGLFLSAHQLCYQNRTIDKYNRDQEFQNLIRTACSTDFLVIDGLFSYVTQNDDLLLQSIYDARQHCGKTTIVTTEIKDPLNFASSILFRIARDADLKVVF